MTEIALLTTALLFGGTVLYAFGFAAFVFNTLSAEIAGPLIRSAFPHFYLFVLATSTLACVLSFSTDAISALLLALIALTTLLARQLLMPAINTATDEGAKSRFKILHTLSVVITLAHIVAAAVVIVRLSNG
ncbi:MAG: DUF4149 domain-containing protein [Paracoccaceae bacterium]|nr:DUF4149 domain-containing protein [Paracoccaceae bacterium]